jgi:hypothetical protein
MAGLHKKARLLQHLPFWTQENLLQSCTEGVQYHRVSRTEPDTTHILNKPDATHNPATACTTEPKAMLNT